MIKEYMEQQLYENVKVMEQLQEKLQSLLEKLQCSREWIEKLQREKGKDINIFSPRSIQLGLDDKLEKAQEDYRKTEKEIENIRAELETCRTKKQEFEEFLEEFNSMQAKREEQLTDEDENRGIANETANLDDNVEKTAEKDRERTAEKGADKEENRIIEKDTDEDDSKITEKCTDKDEDKTADKATDEDIDKDAGKTTDGDTNKDVDKTTDEDINKDIEKSAEKDADEGEEKTVDKDTVKCNSDYYTNGNPSDVCDREKTEETDFTRDAAETCEEQDENAKEIPGNSKENTTVAETSGNLEVHDSLEKAIHNAVDRLQAESPARSELDTPQSDNPPETTVDIEELKRFLSDIYTRTEHCLAFVSGDRNRCRKELKNLKNAIKKYASELED